MKKYFAVVKYSICSGTGTSQASLNRIGSTLSRPETQRVRKANRNQRSAESDSNQKHGDRRHKGASSQSLRRKRETAASEKETGIFALFTKKWLQLNFN